MYKCKRKVVNLTQNDKIKCEIRLYNLDIGYSVSWETTHVEPCTLTELCIKRKEGTVNEVLFST